MKLRIYILQCHFQYFSENRRERSPLIFTETETQCPDVIERKREKDIKREEYGGCNFCSKKKRNASTQTVSVPTYTEVDENIRFNNST